MRLKTIWTIPGMSLKFRIKSTLDWVDFKIATKLPKRVAYWSYIHSVVGATKDDDELPAMRVTDIIDRLPVGPRV